MSLPDGFVEEVRAASSIVGVISSYMPLKKAGTTHKGLCPFHSEKTPSFNVHDDRGFYHCFGCHAGGDVFRFVMEHDNLGFPDAVRHVATLSGIPLPAERRGPGDDRRERLFQVNEAALRLFRRTLQSAEGEVARGYLETRGIAVTTCDRFEIGLTPAGWEGVSRALPREGFDVAELVAVGLAKERPSGGGIYDRFHERLIFPIRNGAGRLVGFGGRAMGGQEPKYLNSPETELYVKSEVLYGFNLSRDAIRRTGQAVLVEGYLDLIAIHQAGVEESVASLGTSLTEQHARLLKRFAKQVYIAYDGDSAGRNAVKRALRTLLAEAIAVVVVEVEDGMDPDDLVRERGAAAFRECMDRARGFVPFLVGMARDADPDQAASREGRVRLVNEVLPVLGLIADPIERAAQTAALAELVGLDEAIISEALGRVRAADGRRGVERQPVATPSRPMPARGMPLPEPAARPVAVRRATEAESMLILALVSDPSGVVERAPWAEPADWLGLLTASILDHLWRAFQAHEPLGMRELAAVLDDPERELLAAITLRHPVEVGAAEGESALRSIRQRRLRVELARIQAGIAGTAGEEIDPLLQRKQELSRLLDQMK